LCPSSTTGCTRKQWQTRANAPLSRLVRQVSYTPNVLTSEQAFRKYSHSLGPDVLPFLENIINKHGIPDEEVESSIEFIAKEYNKQDGACAI
jgi:hypothetical protein